MGTFQWAVMLLQPVGGDRRRHDKDTVRCSQCPRAAEINPEGEEALSNFELALSKAVKLIDFLHFFR